MFRRAVRLKKREAIHAGHHEVEEDQIDPDFREHGEGLLPFVGFDELEGAVSLVSGRTVEQAAQK